MTPVFENSPDDGPRPAAESTPPPPPPPPPPAQPLFDAPAPPAPGRGPLSWKGWLGIGAAVTAAVVLLAGGGFLLNSSLARDTDGQATAADSEPNDSNDFGGGDFGGGDFGGEGEFGDVAAAITPTGAVPTCVAYPPAVDSTGRKISYEAPNATDGDLTTAWRCAGTNGQVLSVSFACKLDLTSVGIDPGYDKKDVDGSDRFVQNRKVTKVTWAFDDGTSVTQEVRPERGIQTLEVDKAAKTVTLTINETVDGQPVKNAAGQESAPFNDVTSVSEVRFNGRADAGADPCVK
ncbi:NADase-type glycan-binding domain-containing protein [Rhodococcus sp. NPDC058514]|uniref:NADase-type glycan-binding domain-containing protein n=1 Tax=unclassified Rhodococcus (in: high G+C Gram-positive bacteria) TaxID=192944 RepID=UPI0036623000